MCELQIHCDKIMQIRDSPAGEWAHETGQKSTLPLYLTRGCLRINREPSVFLKVAI